jgi:predicted protein tyrosine phosphatase
MLAKPNGHDMELETPLLPYRITICGLAELAYHAQAGVSHVISILDPAYPDPDDFGRYGTHRRVVWRFDDVVEVGLGFTEPSVPDVQAILELGRELQAEPVDRLLVHCHAGVSRSTATAIILMVQHNPGREAEAFAELRRLRPRSWPNGLMIGIADHLLAREGVLIAALREHQRCVARDFPEFAEMLARYGRAHEIAALADLT